LNSFKKKTFDQMEQRNRTKVWRMALKRIKIRIQKLENFLISANR
jgi:hypothetical protein